MRYKIIDFKNQYTLIFGTTLFFCIIFSTILISFRVIDIAGGEIYGGTDAPAYKTIYELANTDFLTSLIVQFYEPGYATLVWFFSSYVGSYVSFQMFVYSFLYLSMLHFIKSLKFNFYIAIPLLFLNSMIVSSLNILRITVAVFISFYVLKKLSNNKYLSAFIISILAVTIHTSSLILFPLIFLCYIFDRFSLRLYIVVQFLFFLLSVFLSFYVIPSLISGSRLDEYTTFNEGSFSLNTFIVSLVVIFLTFARFNDFILHNSYNRILISSLPSVFLVMPIFYNYSIGYRFLMFYLPIIFALIPSIFSVYSFKKVKELPFLPLILFLYFYVFIRFFKFFNSELEHSEIYLFDSSYFFNIFGFI